MQTYANLNGDSGVVQFEISATSIVVVFASGTWTHYLYDYAKAGPMHVDQMKRLALEGRGLNAYINTRVKRLYSRRW